MEKYKINKSVSLKSVELWTKTRLISNKRNRTLLSLVSSGWPSIIFVGNVNTLGVQDRVEFLNPEIIHFSSTSRKHTQTTIKLCGIIQNAEAGILR